MSSSSPLILTRSMPNDLVSAQVKAEASVEAKKKTEYWADFVTIKDRPMLEAWNENLRDWEAALSKLLEKSRATISPTKEPDLSDAFAISHHRDLIPVMQKTIDHSLLSFVYNKSSAVRTFAELVRVFPTADEVILQLLAEAAAAAIPFEEAKPYVIAHQPIQAKILNADPNGDNCAISNSSYLARTLNCIYDTISLTFLPDNWRDLSKATATDVHQAGDSIISALKNTGNLPVNSGHWADRSRLECSRADRAPESTGACPRHPLAKDTWAT